MYKTAPKHQTHETVKLWTLCQTTHHGYERCRAQVEHTASRNRAKEQKSSRNRAGKKIRKHNWHTLASISGSRSTLNKHMRQAKMPL